MGEFSKRVGEVGEKIVVDFLRLFGWKNMYNNDELNCINSNHGCETHGIDALFAYKSLLQQQTLTSVVVSAKYSSNPYEKVPSTFKSHFNDIAKTVECYSRSELKRELATRIKGTSKKEDIGVLFYLNNVEDPESDNIKSKILKSRVTPDIPFNTIHLVDNARATFLYSALGFIKSKHGKLSFFCNTTTLNVNSNTRHTSIMPVEYVTSPIIPMSVPYQDGKKFVLLCDFDFSEDALNLVYKLAKKLCADFSNHYEIYFKTFNPLHHDPIVDKVKMAAMFDSPDEEDDDADFADTDVTLEVGTYNNNFRNAF
ncbi:GapS4a family protein [Vibrio parahaemolyticus]|uniref:GapS4a family protein n=1 Tax=Vibrio jasicida TaxID=766224 RepID=UPI0040696EF6